MLVAQRQNFIFILVAAEDRNSFAQDEDCGFCLVVLTLELH